MLKVGLANKVGCVFIDDKGEQMILMRSSRTPQLLSQSGVPWDMRFTFYDQIHTTGMDIKQHLQAVAAITIGKDMTLRDYAQGAWRMRGLGQGQTLHIFIVGEMLNLMSEALGANVAKPPQKLPSKVVAFLLTNSCRLEKLMDGQLAVQNLKTVYRHSAMKQLLEGGPSSKRLSSLAVFKEPISSVVPVEPVQGLRLDQALQVAADAPSVSQYMETLGAEVQISLREQLASIIAKAATDNVLVENSDLNSEMEQEREQEQEQEQEREQEVVSQTARDKAKETPWQISILESGVSSHGALYPLTDFGVPDIPDGEGWTQAHSGAVTQLTLSNDAGAWRLHEACHPIGSFCTGMNFMPHPNHRACASGEHHGQ
eukprot:SAG11_NODE_1922_length_4061_cov_13.009339_4_plen_371_part_00